MINIDWKEFKEFRAHSVKKDDNFITLVDFLKSYYNMFNAFEIYNTLNNDDTAKMMLEKRDIIDAEGLESYLFKVI